jgi:hypothetical protein
LLLKVCTAPGVAGEASRNPILGVKRGEPGVLVHERHRDYVIHGQLGEVKFAPMALGLSGEERRSELLVLVGAEIFAGHY